MASRAGTSLAVAAGVVIIVVSGCGGKSDTQKRREAAQKQAAAAKQRRTAQAFNSAQTTAVTPTTTAASPGVASATPGVSAQGASGSGAVAGAAPTSTAVSAGAGANVANPFNATSPWNTTVGSDPIDPNSDRYILQAQTRIGVIDRPNQKTVQTTVRRIDAGLFVNTLKWTDPVVDETNGQPVRVICRQILCGPDAGVSSVLVPADVAPDPRFDGWFTVINRSQGIAYDFWRARRIGDVISYQYVKKWDLNGNGFSKPIEQDQVNAVSARGSGLPLFGGLILPEELQAGQINHALAISVPGPAQRNYVQPASVTDGVGRLTSIPEGARLRLNADAVIGPLPAGDSRRSANAIVQALKRYGAIVVDRSRVPTLYAKKNFNYGRLLRGNEIQSLHLNDFQVVRTGTIFSDPPLKSGFVNPAAPGTFAP